jgi:aldehyde dehydrogenase (NAD+)
LSDTVDVAAAADVFAPQRRHRWVAKKSSVDERRGHLSRLRDAIVEREDRIQAALHADLLPPPAPRPGFREVSHERAVVIADSAEPALPAGGAAT